MKPSVNWLATQPKHPNKDTFPFAMLRPATMFLDIHGLEIAKKKSTEQSAKQKKALYMHPALLLHTHLIPRLRTEK